MTTLGRRKIACKRGHVNPLRTSQGACVPCGKLYRREVYQRDREKFVKRSRERSAANPEARRDEQRAYRLGVPVSAVREIVRVSGGICGACSKVLTHSQMCVDHDHVTGLLRGVLCRFCNALEGMLHKQAGRVALVQAYTDRFDREIARLKAAQAKKS